jgi:hypothetical protein
MERDRWPDKVCEFVDAAICPRCAAPRAQLLVAVSHRAAPPMWLFRIYCTACRVTHQTEWLDMFQMLKPKDLEPEKTPLPAWVAALNEEKPS